MEHYCHGSLFKRIFKIIGMIIVGICVAILFALIFGYAVMYLWNWLMPSLFGLKSISFYQAFALVLLAKILFGNFGHHPKHHGPMVRRLGRMKHFLHKNKEIAEHFDEYESFWEEKGKTMFKEYCAKKDENAE